MPGLLVSLLPHVGGAVMIWRPAHSLPIHLFPAHSTANCFHPVFSQLSCNLGACAPRECLQFGKRPSFLSIDVVGWLWGVLPTFTDCVKNGNQGPFGPSSSSWHCFLCSGLLFSLDLPLDWMVGQFPSVRPLPSGSLLLMNLASSLSASFFKPWLGMAWASINGSSRILKSCNTRVYQFIVNLVIQQLLAYKTLHYLFCVLLSFPNRIPTYESPQLVTGFQLSTRTSIPGCCMRLHGSSLRLNLAVIVRSLQQCTTWCPAFHGASWLQNGRTLLILTRSVTVGSFWIVTVPLV